MDKQENYTLICEIFKLIEKEFEDTKTLNRKSVQSFFEELKKLDNGELAIKEFTWLFGINESERHFVESKECRKVFLIDFKKCRKLLEKFIKL